MSPDNFGRGRCPMSVAAELGHNEILEFLIAAGGDARNIHDPPLRQAVRRNDVVAVSLLIKGGADPDPTLHQLLWPSCNTAVIRMLLDAGASPSGTMLLTALWRGCESVVIELLLAFGAPFRSDLENESALEVALCRGADHQVVDVLLNAPARWSPKLHHAYARVFRERVFAFLLVNNRLGSAKLPSKALLNVVKWIARIDKEEGDIADLQRSIHNLCDTLTLERRIHALGVRRRTLGGAPAPPSLVHNGEPIHSPIEPLDAYEPSSLLHKQYPNAANPFETDAILSKVELLEGLTARQLLSVLRYEDPALKARPSLHLSSHSEATAEGSLPFMYEERRNSESTRLNGAARLLLGDDGDYEEADADHDEDDVDEHVEKPLRVQVKSSSSANRGPVHPLTDARNPNGPKAHHCTCCHVCHVSMKQRPRPIAACSMCNTIICKLCLQDRWKTDQWDEACSQPSWVCHKCNGTCVCKSCKSKGSRGAASGTHDAPPMRHGNEIAALGH